MIDFEPSDEQQLVIETVRQFAEQEIRPLARECDEAGALPAALLGKAHELGLVANSLPAAHGGGGERSALTGALVAEELGWGDLAAALAILSPGLLALPVADFGVAAQQSALLPGFTGAQFAPGALAVTEPHFGADPFRPRTHAKRDGGDYLLTGAKCLVPLLGGGDGDGDAGDGGDAANAPILIYADDGGTPQGFLVPRNAAGLTVTKSANMGLRALPLVELELADVRVPKGARLGAGDGSDLRALIARGRVALAALGTGVARAAFEIARDYAKEREAFGVKIAQKQAIAFKLADMAIEIDGCRLLAWEAAFALDQRAPEKSGEVLREATLALSQVRRVALEVTDGAVQVLGGHGYIREYLPEMQLRNARGLAAFECMALL